MDYNWHDLVGNIGVAVIILSYLALQLERIDSRSYLFCTLNGAGAAMIILSNSIYQHLLLRHSGSS